MQKTMSTSSPFVLQADQLMMPLVQVPVPSVVGDTPGHSRAFSVDGDDEAACHGSVADMESVFSQTWARVEGFNEVGVLQGVEPNPIPTSALRTSSFRASSSRPKHPSRSISWGINRTAAFYD
jgi:hypothetical protein